MASVFSDTDAVAVPSHQCLTDNKTHKKDVSVLICNLSIPLLSQHRCSAPHRLCLLPIAVLYYLEAEQQKAIRYLLLLSSIHLKTGSSGLSAHLPQGSISPLQTHKIRSDGRGTLRSRPSEGQVFWGRGRVPHAERNFQKKSIQINNSLKLLHVIEKNINGNES